MNLFNRLFNFFNEIFTFFLKGKLASKPPRSTINKTDDIFASSKDNHASITKTDSTAKITLMPWETQEVNYNSPQAKTNSSFNLFNNTNNNTKTDHEDFFSKLNGSNNNSKNNNTSFNSLNRAKVDNKIQHAPSSYGNFNKNSGSFVEDIEEMAL